MVDLAADFSFEKAQEKVKEHYGIDVSKEVIRRITYHHAQEIKKGEMRQDLNANGKGKKQIVVEADGSLVPVVESKPNTPKRADKRKGKQLVWKEFRLAMAYGNGEVDPIYDGTFGTVEETGDRMFECALKAGMGSQTQIHCVGDGAPWIADQNDRVFGGKATFLVDFFHLCEYLAKAASAMEDFIGKDWLKKAKKKCLEKDGVTKLKRELKPFVEPGPVPEEEAPVRQCYRYIENRPGQFKYNQAQKMKLPIGSGRIESGHRSVIQNRLKKSGAWWKKENAAQMIGLRITRFNKDWEGYWDTLFQKAA